MSKHRFDIDMLWHVICYNQKDCDFSSVVTHRTSCKPSLKESGGKGKLGIEDDTKSFDFAQIKSTATLFMCVLMSLYVHIYEYMQAYTYILAHTHTHTLTHAHVVHARTHKHVYMLYVYIYIYIYLYIYVYVHIYIYIHTYIYIYVYVYIWLYIWRMRIFNIHMHIYMTNTHIYIWLTYKYIYIYMCIYIYMTRLHRTHDCKTHESVKMTQLIRVRTSTSKRDMAAIYGPWLIHVCHNIVKHMNESTWQCILHEWVKQQPRHVVPWQSHITMYNTWQCITHEWVKSESCHVGTDNDERVYRARGGAQGTGEGLARGEILGP